MGRKYKQSPIGIARHAWVNRADTKYNTDGLFHVSLVVSGEEAEKFKAEVDEAVRASFEEQTRDMKPAEAKKWSTYYPYTVETDDAGEPTGNVVFSFRQNAKIPLADGSFKDFAVGIRDRHNKPITDNVFGGATIRVLYAPRNNKANQTKQFGVRLDFSMVQLIKAAPMTGGGFDEVADEYAGADSDAATGEADY